MLAVHVRPRFAAGRQAHTGAAGRRLVVLGAVLAMLISGCTYSRVEPGLFTRQAADPGPSAEETASARPPEPTNPKLPVAGQAVWTSAEGLRLQTRFAVHAVRRIEGATVLDWSVTPLRAPGLRRGDRVPAWVDLGLSRQGQGEVNILLLDLGAGRVYRPLSHTSRQEFGRCLCTPLWVAQLNLRIGETRLLQVTYPELPETLDAVDVDLVNLPPFARVPVTPLGQLPTAGQPTDLSRPADRVRPLTAPLRFPYPRDQTERAQSVTVDAVLATATGTAVVWTLTSLTEQPTISVLPYGPPVSGALPADLNTMNFGAASGPQLRPSGRAGPMLGARWVTQRHLSTTYHECLCTDLGIWAVSLRQAGGSASVTTNYPPLPAGVTEVDVVMDGVGAFPRLPVTPVDDRAEATGPAVKQVSGAWTYSSTDPPRGWSSWDWPTPAPRVDQLRHFVPTVDTLMAVGS